MKRYNPQDIEPKWQKIWQETELYKAVDFDETRSKYVMLTEFPYPSGDGLHLGHVREYTLGDIMAREKRMAGYNVLFPMAYDAFGLPTENYAIKNKVTPQAATETNTGNFQQQFKSLGYSIDWSRTFKTSDPDYYKWTQWLFLQFFNKGLAYQDEIAINWCPHCKTGLANEEVVNGRHERCDTVVEKKLLKQWMLKITQYADRLIEGLKDVDYPAAIADQQINWIGRSKGAEITFTIDESDESLRVFTTRPDTLYGVTFMVLAPEHELVGRVTTAAQRDAVRDYVRQAGAKSDIERQETDREKTGVFTGAYAINPVNKEKIPIWIADYVLNNYGTGAIMAVPAHDERDSAFAEVKGLESRVVVDAKEGSTEGILINSDAYSGMSTAEVREKIVADMEKQGVAKERVNYKLRDWIFSRQHYWGEPIPIIHCQKDGAVPVPLEQLPVKLPKVAHYEPTDTGKSPLSEIDEWVNVACPKCGGPAVRETDTMPNWAGSSWYYLRYFDAHNDTAFVDKKKLDYWRDVDLYLGGMEHTTLHLLYSRFWHQFFYDQGLVPTPEPYKARRGQGIVLAADGSKMSKSKGNIINPNHIIDQGYGADALRMAIAFLAPFEQTTPWNDNGVAGTYRFLQRFWVLVQEFLHDKAQASDVNSVAEAALHAVRHKAVKKVGSDLQHMNFNTAVAALMEGVNGLYKIKNDHGFAFAHETWREALLAFTQLLAPFAPHLCEEVWQEFAQDGSVHISAWPVWDEVFLQTETATIVVQVNGKVRTNIAMPKDAVEAEVVAVAREDEKAAAFIVSEPKRIIFVPNKLINFVV